MVVGDALVHSSSILFVPIFVLRCLDLGPIFVSHHYIFMRGRETPNKREMNIEEKPKLGLEFLAIVIFITI